MQCFVVGETMGVGVLVVVLIIERSGEALQRVCDTSSANLEAFKCLDLSVRHHAKAFECLVHTERRRAEAFKCLWGARSRRSSGDSMPQLSV